MSETTIKLYQSLTQIGFDDELAKTVSKRIMGEAENTSPATKDDFNELKTEMKIFAARLNMLTTLNVAIFASILIEFIIR